MENNEMTNIVTTEAVEVAEQAATVSTKNHNGLKNAAIIGGIMTLGAITWEFGFKPIGHKLKDVWTGHKERQKAKKAEIKTKQDIIEDVEDEFSIN